MTDRLEASTRVTLAALLHDLGKFAERADLEVDRQQLATHQQIYCPHREAGGQRWPTHKHAAYTALAFDRIEGWLPKVKGEGVFPFAADGQADDSLINAAARHHRPKTFLQWIVATADRVASGFEREEFERYNQAEDKTETGKNHYQARLLTLFEQMDKSRITPKELQYRYALKALAPEAIFPEKREVCEPADDATAKKSYGELWRQFVEAIRLIPAPHRAALPLWLDHFDSLWQCYTHAIPSATAFNTKPEVPLYDHSKTTAALATALWRYHHDLGHDTAEAARKLKEREDWDEAKFLLIQGDFFGIQNFIFASGGQTRHKAAKLLRGRSFYVSLITECAALAVLEILDLPSTSQITNAAGKFLIVAPNTPETIESLRTVQSRFDAWFLEQTCGQAGLGLAWQPAACNDFLRARNGGDSPFAGLMKRLHQNLERAKYARFDLCGEHPPEPVFGGYVEHFVLGECAVNERAPATEQYDGLELSALAADQIDIGTYLARCQRLILSREALDKPGQGTLRLPIFGYHVLFSPLEKRGSRGISEPSTGKSPLAPLFERGVQNGNIRRMFDFSLPEDDQAPLWNGCARRHINGYVPRFTEADDWQAERYAKIQGEDMDAIRIGDIKTLNHIACEDRTPDENGHWCGVVALGTLKGDIDNLGALFQKGLEQPTFAKMAALSRQVNNYFAVYLPWLCQKKFPNTYTVFAGGDDFFLIGPWRSQMDLARRMDEEFHRYAAGNENLHFSAGLSVSKPGLPIPYLARNAEESLEQAKAQPGKNAVTCFSQTVDWPRFGQLLQASQQIEALTAQWELSTAYVYSLIRLCDMAESRDGRLENNLWRSKLYYRTQRLVLDRKKLSKEERQRGLLQLTQDLGEQGIERFKAAYRIALSRYFYQYRD